MGARTWVLRDPERQRELLDIIGEAGRIRVTDLAQRMALSLTCIRNFVNLMQHRGLVCSGYDITMRLAPRSGTPRVAWLPNTTRLGRRIKPRPIGFTKRASGAYVYPYAPTGTPTAWAGRIQVMAVVGRAMLGSAV